MVYQGWRQAGFCTTRMWYCMQAGLSDCRDLYRLSSGDGFSGFFFWLDNSSCFGIASDASLVMPALYCLRLFGIDVLLLSSIVEIITLSRLEREMLCVSLLTVSQVVLAPVYTYLMQH